MNELEKLEVRKILKRISIKKSNLKLLWPEVNFLQFIDELEQFQQIIEGVDADDSIAHVHLSLVRLRFESLQNTYNVLKRLIVEKFKRIATCPNDILLNDLIVAVRESTLFLCASFHNFSSAIIASTELVYDINAISRVRDILFDLKVEVNIVGKNFYNLQKSAVEEQAQDILRSIYVGVLASSCLKFEQLAGKFPKSRVADQTRHRTFKSKMADAANENESENVENGSSEQKSNIQVHPESTLGGSEEPELILDENLDTTIASDTSHSGTLQASSKFSIAQYKSQLISEIHQQRTKVESFINEIARGENEMQETDKNLEQQRRGLKENLEKMEKQKQSIANNARFSSDERRKKVQDITVQIGQLSAKYEEAISRLEDEKQELKRQLLLRSGKLKEFLAEVLEAKQKYSEKIKLSYPSAPDNDRNIAEDLEALEEIYDEEAGIITKLKATENFQVDDHGVFYVNRANKKVYFAKPEIEEVEIKEHSSSRSQKSTGSMEEEELRETLPLDCESYIKCNLGRPLRQALAAITIYQPSDPINYLANYLLQYRYNEVRNIQRQQDFEHLVAERNRYAKNAQMKNICDDM